MSFIQRAVILLSRGFQKTKKDMALQIQLSLIIFNQFMQGCGAPRANQNTPCMVLSDGSWSCHFVLFFL